MEPKLENGPRLTTARLAWVALIGNAIVILQGAVVRITGSGAGCGRHWPTCDGSIVPVAPGLETSIEFSHRLLSLVVLGLGVWLLVRARRHRRERPGLAFFATMAFVFLLLEAGIGAATVLLGLTGDNTSVARGVWVAAHLVNSLLLIGALSATVVHAQAKPPAFPLRVRAQGALSTVIAVGLVGALLLMFTGGVAAMGNTIFPSESLAEGLRADFDPASHPLIRLRILHPLIAIVVGTYLFVGLGLCWWLKPVAEARRIGQVLLAVYLSQMAVGAANLALLAPALLQLTHLAMAVFAYGLMSAFAVALLGGTAVRAARPAAGTAGLENA